MSTYTLCSDPSHAKYDENRSDCPQCQEELGKGNPRITPEVRPPHLEVPGPKYPGRRRRYEAGDHVRVIKADGLATIDGTPLLNSTGVVARKETQYVEVINDYDGSATPFNWGDLELLKAADDAVSVGPAQRVEVGPCKECAKLRAQLVKILEAIAEIA